VVIAIGIGAAVWAAISLDEQYGNLFQILGSVIGVIASAILAALSFWQNQQYKKQNDDYQKVIDDYNEQTNEHFRQIQEGMYDILKEMRELSGNRSKPVLLPHGAGKSLNTIHVRSGIDNTIVPITYKMKDDYILKYPLQQVSFNNYAGGTNEYLLVIQNRGTTGIHDLTLSDLVITKYEEGEEGNAPRPSQIEIQYIGQRKQIKVLKENEYVTYMIHLPFTSGNTEFLYRIEMFFEMSNDEGKKYKTKKSLKWDFIKTSRDIYGEYKCSKYYEPELEVQEEKN
jgi:pantothenate kinase-related protein Tda10